MNPLKYAPNANFAWQTQLHAIISHGDERIPRGRQTLDLSDSHVRVSMQQPVVTCPGRKLSYQFMTAEAYWILSGDDTVAGIAPWNKHISKFSDDGHRFFGAYGPKIHEQLPFVCAKLAEDPETRQAGLTIWRESPPATKDVPCTVAIWFSRSGLFLDAFVFMRSSDVWLGLPYDIFNFSMLAHLVCEKLNLAHRSKTLGTGDYGPLVEPGHLHLTLVSSHLYRDDYQAAKEVLANVGQEPIQPLTPMSFWDGGQEGLLLEKLASLRDTTAGDPRRWWSRDASQSR